MLLKYAVRQESEPRAKSSRFSSKAGYARGLLFTLFFSVQAALFANSVNLFNNSEMQLRAVIFSADGQLLDEVVLNSRDASTWADDLYQFGYNAASTHAPYTVHWYCMGGKLFGTCKNVASGSIVLAQNCTLGSSECPQDEEE